VNLSGIPYHHAIQRSRGEVVGIVHAHSLHASTWTAFGEVIEPIIADLGAFHDDQVLFTPRRDNAPSPAADRPADTPGNRDTVAAQFAEELGQRNILLWRNHGHWTVGQTVEAAVWRFIAFERAAQIYLAAQAAAIPGSTRRSGTRTHRRAKPGPISISCPIGTRSWPKSRSSGLSAMTMDRRAMLAATLGTLALGACHGQTKAGLEGITLRVWRHKLAASRFMEAAGLPHPYQVTYADLPGGQMVLNAFSGDGLDYAFMSQIPPVYALRSGVPIKLVATYAGDTHNGGILVNRGSSARRIEDLRGARSRMCRAPTTISTCSSFSTGTG
jgi:hypothetical protein